MLKAQRLLLITPLLLIAMSAITPPAPAIGAPNVAPVANPCARPEAGERAPESAGTVQP